jgi:hypothetical protein
VQKQTHLGALIEIDRVGDWQPHEHAGILRVGEEQNALARHHGPADPVVRIAVHCHAAGRGADLDAGEHFIEIGHLRLALPHPSQHRAELALRLVAVEGLLRGEQRVGARHGEGLGSDLAPVAQRGVVEREDDLTLLYRLVGLH